jgi:hypothetical protein
MSSPPPERHPIHAAPAAGQNTGPLTDAVIEAAVDDAIEKAKLHDINPQGVIGNTPAVAQPGRPPMSSKAQDDSVRMLCFGGMTLLTCGGIALVLVASERADPTAVGVFFGGLAVIALALARLLRRAKETVEAAPPEIHNHIAGNVYEDKRDVRTKTNAVWARNNINP